MSVLVLKGGVAKSPKIIQIADSFNFQSTTKILTIFFYLQSNPYGLKDASGGADMPAWTSAGLQPTTGYYPYDPTLAAYG